MNLTRAAAAAACLIGLAAAPAHAAIISPTSVIANTLGELNASFRDENLINRSGLSAGFTSGVTDFDTYLAGSPTHLNPSGGGSGGYASPNNGVTVGDIDFDLGSSFTIKRFALWNDQDNQALGSFTLFIASNTAFTGAINLGTFNAVTDPLPIHAQVFDITDGTGQYVRLRVNGTQRPTNNLVNFGEIAFDATAATVPTPAPIALLGLGLLGLARRRRG